MENIKDDILESSKTQKLQQNKIPIKIHKTMPQMKKVSKKPIVKLEKYNEWHCWEIKKNKKLPQNNQKLKTKIN